jgi:hypothetical protein
VELCALSTYLVHHSRETVRRGAMQHEGPPPGEHAPASFPLDHSAVLLALWPSLCIRPRCVRWTACDACWSARRASSLASSRCDFTWWVRRGKRTLPMRARHACTPGLPCVPGLGSVRLLHAVCRAWPHGRLPCAWVGRVPPTTAAAQRNAPHAATERRVLQRSRAQQTTRPSPAQLLGSRT